MKLSRLIAIGFVLTVATTRSDAVVFPNLMNNVAGYWPFDETGGGIAHEASGFGINGALINYVGNQGSWTAGQIGGALDFGGLAAQQYVRVPDFTKPTTSLTLSAWVRADSLPQWATVAANWNGVYGALNYGMFGSDPRLSFYFAEPHPQGINVANGSEFVGSSPLTLGPWHYLAVVANGATHQVSFWRDGQSTGGFGFSGSFYPAPVPHLNIGGEPTYGNPSQGYWDGQIDDLALWTRALSSQEIGAIYSAGLSGQSLLTLIPEPTAATLVALCGFCVFLRQRRRA